MLYSDPAGAFPVEGDLDQVVSAADDPELFRFRLSGTDLDSTTQEVRLAGSGESPEVEISWRDVRPIPADDDFFENVWRRYRETGGVS
ncbi:hypothetical protein SDC9_112169 [bioreactor metagenome]|uniref:Uncharacterized protein n=1 Tax=bioreactor metagenome TaxID=1076179 RepID=A0A645BU01_9ZZZZ